MSRAELKARAKSSLQGNWGTAIAVMLVLWAINGICNALGINAGTTQVADGVEVQNKINVIGFIINGALSVGACAIYLDFLRKGKAEFVRLFDGFTKCFVASLIANIVMGILIALGFVLLVVPGICLSIMFSQTFYILNDHPDLGGIGAIKASRELMKGHWGEYFVLCLSFIPWFLLCIFVIPIFYVGPYVSATMAAYYEKLAAEQVSE